MNVFIIDAFTNELFKGNPAGVCLLNSEISTETMQNIAGELNLSETAFLKQSEVNENTYHIRYFTPTVEIAFCGHATLASSKLILHYFKKQTVNFITFQNLKLSAISAGESIKMKFPLYGTTEYKANNQILDAFGITNAVATKYSSDLDMLLIEVKNKETLIQLNPDFSEALKSNLHFNGVIVTAKSNDSDYDFYSRCFCPWIGINEDPVTGSSHSVLTKYWSSILEKTEMIAYQASKRGGFMKLKILDSESLEVESNAKIVFEGILNLE